MIYKKCIMTINKNNATLDEDIYLFRLDKNIELYFSIVNNRYKFDKSDLNNIIAQTNAAYFQIRLYKSDEIKYTFAIQPTQDGVAVLTITNDLIDDPIEVGEYDFQISLLDADKTSMISMPIVTKQLHVCEPLVSDTALMGKAVLGLSTAANGEIKNAFDSEGNYIREIHNDGEIISAQLFNKFEEALETNTKAIKAGTGGGGTGGTYDDSAIKADINAIKTELGTDALTTTAKNIKGAINEVNKKIGTGTGTAPTVNSVEPVDGDIPRVFFNGEKPTSKAAVHATIEYKSKTEHFKGYVEIKCQGTSSMAYPKKNYTIKMFTDSTMAKKVKKDFKGWGEQSKFCLKANYIDHSHARNICAAKLWNQIVASRANYTLLPELLRTSPCNGAIDGFPIKVYYNNTYEGVYTWNIPKDKWMFNMDDTLDNHCVLCGEEYKSGCFLTANATLWSDEIHDTMPQSIITSFNAFQNFVITSTDEQFKANLENYVYVDSLIDYYIFQYVICGLDSMGKNQLFATYDGTKWIATSYDMDSTFGIYWNGQSFVAPTYRMQDDYESVKSGAANKLYVRLEKLFVNEIKARYSQLRADILSYNNIVNTFEPFMDTIGNDLYAEDLTIYSGIPSGSTNNIQQIRNYYRDRVTYVDVQISKLVSAIACTNITLNNATLSFTTDAAQTLTATLTPTDTTDTVVWSVNPTGVCTVEDGVVTAIKNGTCVITATCGTQKATCNVTVNLPSVACTSIALNKTALQLGTMQGAAPDTETNLLEGLTWKDGQLNDNTGLLGTGTDKCITNIQIPGTGLYTLSANVRYTYLKMCLFNSNNQLIQTDMSGINSVPTSIYVYEPNCHMSISLFPNSLEFDVNNVTLKYVHDLANTPNKDADFQANVIANPSLLTTSGDYSIFELYADKIYSDVAAIKLGSNIYKLYNTSVTSNNNLGANAADTSITRMKNGYCTKGTWQNKTLFNIAVPSTWGTTKEDIANYIQTNNIAVVMNPSEYLNSADKISSTTINSYQLKPTIQPNNCTDSVEWSTSPTGIVIVNNGLVNAVKNGEAVVTATCGTKSATCNVTVSGISTHYTITNNLTNCTNSNSVTTIEENGTYSATISANSGCELENVTVTMGGTDITSTSYSNRVITINSVTGDIIITANATSTGTNALYTLPQETVFNGTSDYVDTGVQLFKTDQDFTIIMDVTADNDQVESTACIFHCMKEQSPFPGITFHKSGASKFGLAPGSNTSAMTDLIDYGQRTKVVIVKNDTTIKVYTSNGTNKESAYNFTSIEQTLILGGYQTLDGVKGRFFKGTIYEFSIIKGVYTAEQISNYFGKIPDGKRVFKIDSTCMNTESNKLTDSIGGIEATLVGAPTVSNNQIVFTENDSFNFDLSSLNLSNNNRTFRIKFTPTTLDTKNRCIFGIGVHATDWNGLTSGYIKDDRLIMQHGNKGATNNTIGNSNSTNNRLPEVPAINTEYEIVITENINNTIRWFVNGTLVQDGITTLYSPLALGNTENINRFVGSYSLIEIYAGFCDTYEDFTNMAK